MTQSRFLVAALSSLLPHLAAAQSPTDLARVEVLSGWDMPDGRQMAALKITLAPGWKTYWRSPGDAGVPPVFHWTGSQNVDSVAFHWPTPEVIEQDGMRTLGYHDSLVLPIEIGTTGAAMLAGDIELGICEEICVPATLSFSGALVPSASRNPEIVAALVDQPIPGPEAGAGQATCQAEPTRDGLRVTWSVDLPPQGGQEVVVIEAGTPGVWMSEAETRRDGSRLTAEADMVVLTGLAVLDRSLLRATVIGDSGSVDLQGCIGG